MNFRKADRNDLEPVETLYHSVIGMPFCTWDESYPGKEEIEGDFSAGSLYVLEEEGKLIGAISIVPENEFDDFDFWTEKENTREFARVVIRPDYQHQGLSWHLVEGVEKELKRQKINAIHIAVAKQNIPAQRLYRKMGYSICGEGDMFGHSFILCEKKL